MRIVLFIVLGLYLLPPFIANWSWTYFERNADRDYLIDHWWLFLPASFAFCAFLFWMVIKSFPSMGTKYKRFTTVAMGIAFIFILILNTGYIRFVNCFFGQQQPVVIEGIITDKDTLWKRPRKRQQRYIYVTTNTKEYCFKVKSGAFREAKTGAAFSKEFTTGSLGILYRADQ